MGKSFFRVFLVLGWLFSFGTGFSLAESLPVAPRSKAVYQDVMKQVVTAGKEMGLYETELTPEELLAFYKKELEKRGYTLFMQTGGMVSYVKGSDNVTVAIMPGQSPQEKQKFMIAYTNMDEAMEKIRQPPACEEIPGVPVYPGARCSSYNRMEQLKAQSATYLSSDSLDEVLGYYTNRMPRNGWKLDYNTDIAEYLQKANKGSVDLPGATPNNTTFKGRQLVFSGAQNKKCVVMIIDTQMAGTTINIIYNEETKKKF